MSASFAIAEFGPGGWYEAGKRAPLMAASSRKSAPGKSSLAAGIRDVFQQGTPPPGYVDTETIRINQNGLWLADGKEITHEPTARLFARSIRRDDLGYFLHIGHEYKRIEVEDTAFFVLRVDGDPERGYEVSLSDETRERLDPKTLSYRPGRLTCRVKNGEEEAKFLSPAYFEILKDVQEDGRWYYLLIEKKRVDLAHFH